MNMIKLTNYDGSQDSILIDPMDITQVCLGGADYSQITAVWTRSKGPTFVCEDVAKVERLLHEAGVQTGPKKYPPPVETIGVLISKHGVSAILQDLRFELTRRHDATTDPLRGQLKDVLDHLEAAYGAAIPIEAV